MELKKVKKIEKKINKQALMGEIRGLR